MAKVLIGAVITAGGIEATYAQDILGAERMLKKASDWPQPVVAAASQLIQVCDDLTPENGDVRVVQIYSARSDPQGTGHAAPGECVDVTFAGQQAPVRAGEGDVVPAQLAAARDALKAAISAAL